MHLNDEIQIRSAAFARRGDESACGFDESIHRHILKTADERVEFQCGEAFFDSGLCGIKHRLWRIPAAEEMQADFIAAVSAEQLPNRHAEMFALDIPQRDVHCTDSTAQRSATERPHAVEILPVVFNPQRVLAEEIFLKGIDDFFNRFGVAPARSLAYTADAGIRVDA